MLKLLLSPVLLGRDRRPTALQEKVKGWHRLWAN